MTEREGTRLAARFVFDTSFEEIPPPVVHRAKLCVMDTLGAMLAGLDTGASGIARRVVEAKGGREEASVFGSEAKAPASEAAFANCFAANILDVEEGHHVGGHSAAVVVPAALAVAEAVGATGRGFLEAVVVAYEVSLRAINILTGSYRHGPDAVNLPSTGQPYHSTGTGACYGAAAAAAKLLRCDAAQTENALSLAGLYAPATRPQQPAVFGAMEKESIDWAGKTGIEAAVLAKQGFTGSTAVFDNQDTHEANDFTRSLGTRFEILNSYFKPYPACRYTHSAIEATASLLRDHGISSEEVSRVVVRGHRRLTPFDSARPISIVQAQFSLPFVIGAVLAHGRMDVGVLKNGLDDYALLRAASKVSIEHDPSLEQHPWSSEVRIETVDGRTYERRRLVPTGDPKEPMSETELVDKFMSLAEDALKEESADRLVNLIGQLESIPVYKIVNVLRLAAPRTLAGSASLTKHL